MGNDRLDELEVQLSIKTIVIIYFGQFLSPWLGRDVIPIVVVIRLADGVSEGCCKWAHGLWFCGAV